MSHDAIYEIINKAQKLHIACVKAAFECPQFAHHKFYLAKQDYLDNSSILRTYEETCEFWAHENVLWRSGYAKYLPDWALKEFDLYCAKIGHHALLH